MKLLNIRFDKKQNYIALFAIIIFVIFSPYIHSYTLILFDVWPYFKNCNSDLDVYIFPLSIKIFIAVPYFFISLILYILFSIKKIYSFIYPIAANFVDMLSLYFFAQYDINVIYGYKGGILIANIITIIFAVFLSYVGCSLGMYIKKRVSQHFSKLEG